MLDTISIDDDCFK